MNIQKDSVIGTIVAEDYRAAGIFQKYNIDLTSYSRNRLRWKNHLVSG